MNNKKLSNLIRDVACGDMNALKEIWTEMQRGITSFAFMYLKDRQLAEDATQETFIRIIRGAKNYTKDINPKAWILTITRNIVLSMNRKNSREVQYDDFLYDLHDHPSLEDKISDNIYLDYLMNKLNDRERKILVLHAVSGLKHREIAGLLELPLGTVYRTYSESMKKLRNYDRDAKLLNTTGDFMNIRSERF